MPGLLDLIKTYLPFTPIGKGLLAADEQQQMTQYRNMMMQRQQQEWDQKQQQTQAAQQAFKPGAPHPEQIPVTPMVGSPGYDQAKQQLDQTQIGTASAVDFLKGPQSQIAQALAAAGQFGQAGQMLVNNAPQEQVRNFTPEQDPLGMGGAGQLDPTGLIRNYTRPTTDASDRPLTQMAQLRADLKAGRITQEDFDAAMKKETTIPGEASARARLVPWPVFDEDTGETFLAEYSPDGGIFRRGPNGEQQRVGPNVRAVPPGMDIPLGEKQFNDLQDKYLLGNQQLRRLDTYFKTIGNTDFGLKRLGQMMSAHMKTLFSSGKLSPQEFAAMSAKQQLETLLGGMRVPILGPGVMTEPDAQRLVSAVGGDVNAWQNPEVVASALKEMFEIKREEVGLQQQQLSRSRTARRPAPPSAYEPTAPGLAGDDLSPEEQAELDELERRFGGK
jgi:hypothetical protein